MRTEDKYESRTNMRAGCHGMALRYVQLVWCSIAGVRVECANTLFLDSSCSS